MIEILQAAVYESGMVTAESGGGGIYFGDDRSGGLAGPTGLFIILSMAVALILLIRNMNKRLRRLPASFEDQEPDAPQSGQESTDPAVR